MKKIRLLIIAITFLAASTLTITAANATSRQSLNDPNPAEELSYVPGELIITLKKESNEPAIRENSDFHSRMIDTIPNFENSVKWESAALHVSLIKVKEGEELVQIEALKQNPNIESVRLNAIHYARGHVVSTDPNFLSQWHLNATNATDSWHYTTGSPNIIVAVLDTGIEWTHSDLSSGIWNNTNDSCTVVGDNDNNGFIDDCRGWDFVNNDNNPTDDRDHGTFVSGIIGARLNNVFGASMAPNISLMPIKVLNSGGGGSEVNIIKGIEYAVQNGAHVINMSLGRYDICDPDMQNAVDLANANGVVVVVAAGESAGTDIDDSWPLCDHVISVIATDNFNNSASYSDWVDTNDLSAPGGDTLAFGGFTGSLPIASTYLNNTFGVTVLNNLGQHVPAIGTSFAASHVSGCAALMKTLDSTLGADLIQSKMEESALDLTDSGFIPNLATVGKDKVFGWGLLQCDAALLAGVVAVHPVNITSVAPISSSSINDGFSVNYTLNKVISSGTIVFARTGGTADGVVHIYNFATGDKTSGPHSIPRAIQEIGFGNSLISGAIYNMTISATDYLSNVATVNNTSITYDATPPTFTIQYYSDSNLTIQLGDNPKLNVGTYYLKITSNEALSGTPTISIAAQGTANDVNNAVTLFVSGNNYKFTRTIAIDVAATGTTLEDISITGTDLVNNTSTGTSPTNEAVKAAFTDALPPCSAALDPWVISSGCKITSNVSAPGNVEVQNGAVVKIENTGSLNINFATKFLKIQQGSGILIKPGGKIN